MPERWTLRWIRADGAVLLALTLWAVTATHGSWIWFFALLLVPDLSVIGLILGTPAIVERVGGGGRGSTPTSTMLTFVDLPPDDCVRRP